MKSTRIKSKWYLDGCSRHMTGDKEKFNKLDAKDGGHITFGDNTKGKIIGIGEIGNPQSLSIHHVLFVDGLKHNLYILLNPNLSWPRLVSLKVIQRKQV